ncbi:MAG: ROK family protein, partial [Clostridia bacterium]|nr:ROK family protein [Clostridia bacterium]
MNSVIGIDMGGTKCAIVYGCIVDGNINIMKKVSFSTGIDMPPKAVIKKIINNIKEMNIKAEAIGISCGGPLD